MNSMQELGLNFGLDFYKSVAPILILTIGSLVTLLQAVFKPISSNRCVFVSGLAFLVAAFLGLFWGYHVQGSFLFGTITLDKLTFVGSLLVLGISLYVYALFFESIYYTLFFRGEVVSLFFLVLIGMLVMVSTLDIISLFVGLELMSIGLYALIGYIKPTRASQEGAIKYFVLGAFATGFLLMGIALLYSATGSLNIPDILERIGDTEQLAASVKAGALMFVIVLSFKFGLVPFHMWTPDAYESAPTPLTAFMATAVKAVLAIVAIRFFAEGFESLSSIWKPALVYVAALSVLLANLMALVQGNIKRMLAYSSIAHSGYMAMAFAAMDGLGGLSVTALLFYIVAYTVVSLGAFTVVSWLENEDVTNLTVEELCGLGSKQPFVAFCLAVFMISFAGFPPTAGFLAKFFIFSASISQGLYLLVIFGVIGSTLSLFFYLRVLVNMYMRPLMYTDADIPTIRSRSSRLLTLMTAACVLLTILGGTYLPQRMLSKVQIESNLTSK